MKSFIPLIIDREACTKHGVPIGVPCWHISTAKVSEGYLPAICGSRAKHAGFQGKINESSIRLSTRKSK